LNAKLNCAAVQVNSAQSWTTRSSVHEPVAGSIAFRWSPSMANQLPTSRTMYSPMNPGSPAPPPGPLLTEESGERSPAAVAGAGNPAITSGTVGLTSAAPISPTSRTTSAMRSGSQAMNVRTEKVSTTLHPPGSQPLDGAAVPLSGGTPPPPEPSQRMAG
jgi:hypothetical protein